MVTKRKLKIVKVPLPYKQEYKSIHFGPMPQLYLDLIENKAKVKEHLKDVYYEPKWDNTESQHLVISNEEVQEAGQDFKNSLQEFDPEGVDMTSLKFEANERRYRERHQSSQNDMFTDRLMEEGFSKPYNEAVNNENSPHGSLSKFVAEDISMRSSKDRPTLGAMSKFSKHKFTKVDDDETKSSFDDPFASVQDFRANPKPQPSSKYAYSKSSVIVESDAESDNESSRYHGRQEEYKSKYEQEETKSKYEEYDRDKDRYKERYKDYDTKNNRDEPEEQDAIGDFLAAEMHEPKTSQSIYGGNRQESYRQPKPSSSFSSNPYQPQPSSQPSVSSGSTYNRPPGLDEISKGVANKSRVMNITQNSKTDEERNARRTELLYKFKTLRSLYKGAQIPEFSEYTDVEVLERELLNQQKHLQLESNVENYKRYLTMGFGVLEFLVHKFLKFEEISGFASQQVLSMNQYEKILYEIGEKHKPTPGKGLPPEIKLMGIITFNAAMFVLMNMLTKGIGNPIMKNVVDPGMSRSSGPIKPSMASGLGAPGRKPMAGPDIDLDDLN